MPVSVWTQHKPADVSGEVQVIEQHGFITPG